LRKIDPAIKIIGMSGMMNDEQTAELQNLNVSAFLIKPFSTEKLLMSISDLLAKR